MRSKEYIDRENVLRLAYSGKIIIGDSSDKLVRELIEDIPAADVRPVVVCADCKWWTKQEASLQGRCELLQMYPTGAWFCANGKREES